MAAVRKGVGRETAHEAIKEHAVAVALEMRERGWPDNDLLDRLAADGRLGLSQRRAGRPGRRAAEHGRHRAGPGRLPRRPGGEDRRRSTPRRRPTRRATCCERRAVSEPDADGLGRRFVGRVVVVTGAGHGIGRAVAERLAAEGARLVLADLDEDAATATAESLLPAEVVATHCDVHLSPSVDACIDLAVRHFGQLDVLVNVAGGSIVMPAFEDMTDEAWNEMLDLNLTGAMRCIRAALPHLRQRPTRGDRVDQLRERSGRFRGGGLLLGQGRSGSAHPQPRDHAGSGGHPRQRGRSRHRTHPRLGRSGRWRRPTAAALPARPGRRAERHRRGRGVPGLRRRAWITG